MDKNTFLENIRTALGRDQSSPEAEGIGDTPVFDDLDTIATRAAYIVRDSEETSYTLMEQLTKSGEAAGWKIARATSLEDAAIYIRTLATDLEARSIVYSDHQVITSLDLNTAVFDSGIETTLMAIQQSGVISSEEQRSNLRKLVTKADLGVTGVDYVIADTGTCVIIPKRGVSRLVSLLPPVYVAVVERKQIIPSLDALMTLRRHVAISGNPSRYMSLITGPSRTADIEYTIVTGVHGPGEVHMVLIE